MAEPVKTLIMRAVVETVKAISIVGSVKRNPPTSPRRETDIFPAVYVYDDTESKVNNNRYSKNTFPIQIETYFLADDDDASEQAELIDSEIYKAILVAPAILALINSIKPEEGNSTSRQFLDEFTGALISRYVVVYQHKYGDPTDQAK
jgi:hypothetical protein